MSIETAPAQAFPTEAVLAVMFDAPLATIEEQNRVAEHLYALSLKTGQHINRGNIVHYCDLFTRFLPAIMYLKARHSNLYNDPLVERTIRDLKPRLEELSRQHTRGELRVPRVRVGFWRGVGQALGIVSPPPTPNVDDYFTTTYQAMLKQALAPIIQKHGATCLVPQYPEKLTLDLDRDPD